MTIEKANQIIRQAGFTQYDVKAPSKETRFNWYFNIQTGAKGWKPLRIPESAGEPEAQLAAWVNSQA